MYIHGHREKDLEKKKFSPIFIRLFSFFLNNFLSLSEFRVEKLKKVIFSVFWTFKMWWFKSNIIKYWGGAWTVLVRNNVNRGKVKRKLRVTSSNPRVTSSNPRVTSSNSRVTISNPRVRRLKARVARLKARVARLKSRVARLKVQIGRLKARVGRLKARVETINKRVR